MLSWCRHRFQIVGKLGKQRAFSNSIVFKSFHSGESFRIDPFSLIVFGDVV